MLTQLIAYCFFFSFLYTKSLKPEPWLCFWYAHKFNEQAKTTMRDNVASFCPLGLVFASKTIWLAAGKVVLKLG